MVVHLNQVNLLPLKTGQTLLHRLDNVGLQAPRLMGGDPELGANIYIGRQLLQHLPEICLRLAVTVGGCGVEVIDAQLNSPRGSLHLIAVLAPDHQASNIATAKSDLGHLKSGIAKRPIVHRKSPICSLCRQHFVSLDGSRHSDSRQPRGDIFQGCWREMPIRPNYG